MGLKQTTTLFTMILQDKILFELEEIGEHTHTQLTTCTTEQEQFCIFRFFVSYVSRGETHTHTPHTHKLKKNVTPHCSHYKEEQVSIFSNFFLL